MSESAGYSLSAKQQQIPDQRFVPEVWESWESCSRYVVTFHNAGPREARVVVSEHPRSAPTWPAALSLLAFSLCASLVPCDTSSPTPTQRWPPTVPRRLRDADESDPHFRPRRLCSNVLRRARSDQDDQPAAGHAGARDGHCTLSSVTTLGPLCTKNCAPDKGNIATPQYTHIPLFRLYRARNPCPETLYPISRYRVK